MLEELFTHFEREVDCGRLALEDFWFVKVGLEELVVELAGLEVEQVLVRQALPASPLVSTLSGHFLSFELPLSCQKGTSLLGLDNLLQNGFKAATSLGFAALFFNAGQNVGLG